jgi:hypothetical protein
MYGDVVKNASAFLCFLLQCLRKSGEHVCPVTGTDFRIASQHS